MNRIAKAMMTAAVAFVVALSFQIMLGLDEVSPAGMASSFNIEAIDTSTKAAARETLNEAADAFAGTLVKVQPDPRSSLNGRILYVFGPESFGPYESKDYPAFSPSSQTTTIRPASAITTEDLRGRYATTLAGNQLSTLTSFLNEHGLRTQIETTSILGIVMVSIGQSNFAGTLLVVFFSLLLAISYSVAQQRKALAIRTLHGYRSSASYGLVLLNVTRAFGGAVLGITAVGVPLLAWYNGFNQFRRFLPVVGISLVILLAIVCLIATISVAILDRGSIPQIIKGERASLEIGVLGAVVHVLIIAISVGTASATINRMQSIDESLALSEEWTDEGSLYALRLSVTVPTENLHRDSGRLMTIAEDLEDKNNVLFVRHRDVGGLSDPEYGPDGNHSMMVNPEYLRRKEILDPDGKPLSPASTRHDEFVLLIPQKYAAQADSLRQQWEAELAKMCDWGREKGYQCQPVARVQLIRDGQTLSTYGNTQFLPLELQGAATLKDPVIGVMSLSSGVISPVKLTDYISSDDVFFTDAEVLDSALTAAGIRQNFQGIDNAADAVAKSMAVTRHELRMDTISLTLAIATLIAASTILVMVYCDRRLRPLFVQLIHGYGYVSRHWTYLAGSLALSLVGLAIAHVAGGSLHSGHGKVLAALFVLGQLVIAATALRVFESRFRADYIKRG